MTGAASSSSRDLLERALSPDSAAVIFKEKIQYKPLHLRATSPDPSSQDARAQRRLVRQRKRERALRRKPKPKPLSAKDKRISGVYDIPKDLQKYHIYLPLHEMWIKYIWDILGLKNGQQTFLNSGSCGNLLATADYHGAKLTVVRSKCSSLVNLQGIVAKDTKFTFQIITVKNELKSGSRIDLVRFLSDCKQLYLNTAQSSNSRSRSLETNMVQVLLHLALKCSIQNRNVWPLR